MKNNIVLLIIGFLLFLSSCNEEDFLKRYPLDQPSPEIFFVNEETARMAVNACYYTWKTDENMLRRDMTILLDAMTDDSYWRPNRNTSIALAMWNINPTHINIQRFWLQPMQSIGAANFAIDRIPQSTDPAFTAEKQAYYIAEAKFMRAYSYLFLTSFFGDVPLHTKAASNFEAFYSPRKPKAEVLAQVVKDFIYAKENLPASQTITGTPDKTAAAAFLAKTYLYLKDWAKAEAAAREAIQIGESSGHKMQDNYLSIWSDEGNAEILFAWSYMENDPNYGQNMTVQRNCRSLPATLKSAIIGDGWGYALPQKDLYDAFEEGDPRREFTIYSPGHNYEIYPGTINFSYKHEKYDATGNKVTWDVTYKPGDMVEYDYRWSETGMNVRKMTNPVKNLSAVENDGMDIPAMRMAEVYLILAEALAEQTKPEALIWVNKVRARASVNMPPKTIADGSLVNIVRHERRVELAMEGIRIFDLIRWGTLSEVFGNGKKVKNHFFSDFLPESSSLKFDSPIGNLKLDPVFPIPQAEIDANPEINENNPGW